MTVPFGHSKYQDFSKSSCLSLFFTYRVLCSLKISEIPFWWMLKTKRLRFRATCGLNWHAFGSIRVFTKYSIFYFCLLTVRYHHSKLQKYPGLWIKFRPYVKSCKMRPITIFVYLFWPVIKQKYWPDSENKVSKHFWLNVYPILGFGDVFRENGPITFF